MDEAMGFYRCREHLVYSISARPCRVVQVVGCNRNRAYLQKGSAGSFCRADISKTRCTICTVGTIHKVRALRAYGSVPTRGAKVGSKSTYRYCTAHTMYRKQYANLRLFENRRAYWIFWVMYPVGHTSYII